MAAFRIFGACFGLVFVTVQSSPVPSATDASQSGVVSGDSGGTWTHTHDMPQALMYTAMTTLQNGSTFLVGGQTTSAYSDTVSSTQRYDPETNEWHAGPLMRSARSELGLVTGQTGLVYAMGGVSISNAAMDTVEVYNTANNSWDFVAPMPVKRSRFAATVLKDGSIFVAGGYSGGTTKIASVYLYFPATNSWAEAPSMSTALCNIAATTLPDGRVFVAGGTAGSIGSTEAHFYDPTTKVWSTAAAMPHGAFGNGLVTLPSGYVLSVGGGQSTWTGSDFVQMYFPENNTWALMTSMPFSAYAFGTAVLQNGSVLVAGGWLAGGSSLKTAYMWTDPSSGGSLEYRCVGSQSHCEVVPKGDGVPLEECEKVCGPPVNTYECINSRCVKSPNGVAKDVCDRICRPQFLDDVGQGDESVLQ